MFKNLSEILVCPLHKESKLELFELKTKKLSNELNLEILETIPIPKDILITDYIIVEEGLLFCNMCFRFYPIIEEIPIILPDGLREKEKDLNFLKKWHNNLPDKIIKQSMPWHL